MNSSFKTLLQQAKLAPHRQLGQNFLTNSAIARRIVTEAEITKEDTVIEIGPGLGSLTIPLTEQAKQVIAIEIDRGIITLHQEKNILPDNVDLIHQDILKTNFKELYQRCGGPIKIVANLPYSISSPLLFALIENRHYMDLAILMLQKEVADRLTAHPRTKTYGILSILLAYVAKISQVMQVGPGNFHPRPRVDSAVVKLQFQPPPTVNDMYPEIDMSVMRSLVKAAFGQRRKTLNNSLASVIPDKSIRTKLFEYCNIEATARADQLSLENYLDLTVHLCRLR